MFFANLVFEKIDILEPQFLYDRIDNDDPIFIYDNIDEKLDKRINDRNDILDPKPFKNDKIDKDDPNLQYDRNERLDQILIT